MTYLKISPTNKKSFEIPVNVIAKDRAHYYVKRYNRSFDHCLEESMTAFKDFECLIEYWATKKMDWKALNKILKKENVVLDKHEWLESSKQIVKH